MHSARCAEKHRRASCQKAAKSKPPKKSAGWSRQKSLSTRSPPRCGPTEAAAKTQRRESQCDVRRYSIGSCVARESKMEQVVPAKQLAERDCDIPPAARA